MTAEPRHAVVTYPGGLRIGFRWGGSGSGRAVFALTEAGGELVDHGPIAGESYERMCRAELRVETPSGIWTARLASTVFDDPAALLWDGEGLLVVKYGFRTYAFEARSGALRWSHRSGSPLVALIGSSRLRHLLVQSEVETFAIGPDGEVAWRVAHSEVVADAALVGGRLVLTGYGGQLASLDPATGRSSR